MRTADVPHMPRMAFTSATPPSLPRCKGVEEISREHSLKGGYLISASDKHFLHHKISKWCFYLGCFVTVAHITRNLIAVTHRRKLRNFPISRTPMQPRNLGQNGIFSAVSAHVVGLQVTSHVLEGGHRRHVSCCKRQLRRRHVKANTGKYVLDA